MPTTFDVLDQRQRQGTDLSATALVPSGVTSVRGEITMTAADRANILNAIRWHILVSLDGVSNWVRLHSDEWTGGTHIDKFTGLPTPNLSRVEITVQPQYWGWRVRLEVDIAIRQTCGATVTIFP